MKYQFLIALMICALTVAAWLVQCGCAARDVSLDLMHSALKQVEYEPRAERVEDFAQFCPPRESFRGVVHEPASELERITTAVPWPRGLAMVDGSLVALARGRHRSGGGVPTDFDDLAGTLFQINPSVAETVVPGEVAGQAVRRNARVLARPASPPFFPFDQTRPPEDAVLMTRPYCGLDYDPVSRNLFVCAFAGAELDGGRRFRKHATDSILRFDLRDASWHVVEQHDPDVVPDDALGAVISNAYYPHHDPRDHDPPHGWLNGPTGCAAVGEFLYATSKDNHLVVQYELNTIRAASDAAPPPSRPVLGPRVRFRLPDGRGGWIERQKEVLGAAAVTSCGEWLYVGSRTSSIVCRVPIDDRGELVHDAAAELIAVFEPWCADRRRSGNMFDLALNSQGDLFVSMATEGRVWRITPDPANPFYADDHSARPTTGKPFLDLAKLTGKRTSAGNLVVDDEDRLYVCTRNNDVGEGPIAGTIYRAATRSPER